MNKELNPSPTYEEKVKELYNWLFHYNPYSKTWNAFLRDDVSKYFNGEYENTVSAYTHKVCVRLAYEKELERQEDV